MSNANKPLPQPTSSAPPKQRTTFSLASILVITVVVAFVGAVLGHLFRAIDDPTPVNTGYLALAAAVAPTLILVVAGAAFNLFRWLKSYRNPITLEANSEESR